MTNHKHSTEWDAFISYASEDRDIVARPLADALSALGLHIWFDQFELTVGDSLRERIDDGLARSAFGIVIISPAFFNKHYPNRELNGLAQRESDGEKVILPVWYDVNETQVRHYSPPLADRIAARWDEGFDAVVQKLFAIVGHRVIAESRRAAEKIIELRKITSGDQLVDILEGAHAHRAVHDELKTKEELDLVSTFLDGLGDSIDCLAFSDGAGERARVVFAYTEELELLRNSGWTVFAARAREPMPEGVSGDWTVGLIAVLRDWRTDVAYLEGKFLVADRRSRDVGV